MWFVYWKVNAAVGGTRMKLIGWVRAENEMAALAKARSQKEFTQFGSAFLQVVEVTGDFGTLKGA